MANIGDDAALAGMAVVDGATTDANTIDTELNRTRDYLATGKMKDGALAPAKIAGAVPIAKGGTSATSAAQARATLGVTPENIKAAKDNTGSVLLFTSPSFGRLNYEIPGKSYVTTIARIEDIALLTDIINALVARVEALENRNPDG